MDGEQQQQQQTDTALSRWQLLRNPCCLACPELCEAEKRPKPKRASTHGQLQALPPATQLSSTGHAMVGGGRRKAGRTPAPDKKLPVPQCKSIPIVTWRELVACKLERLHFRTTHLAATYPHYHAGATSQRQTSPTPTATIPAVFDTQILPPWRPHFKEEGQEMLPLE
jgi:hypothetical protein